MASSQPQPQPFAQLPTPFAQASLQPQPQRQQQPQPADEPADEDLLPSPRPISDLPVRAAAAAAPGMAQGLEHGGGDSTGPPLAGPSGRDSAAEATGVPLTPANSLDAEETGVPLTPAPSPEVDWGRPAGLRGGLRSHRLSEDDWARRQAEPSAQQAPAGVSKLSASGTQVHKQSCLCQCMQNLHLMACCAVVPRHADSGLLWKKWNSPWTAEALDDLHRQAGL